MINLRPYQLDAIKAVKDTFKTQFRQFIEMPTGSGKTITFLSYARENHSSVLVIVPSKELLKQVYESALIFYEPWEITRKGARFDEDFLKIEDWEIEKYGDIEKVPRIHICIINSIRGDYQDYLARSPFDLIIIDECHHSSAPCYQNFLKSKSKYQKEDSFKVLGVTATPDRLDGLSLKKTLYNKSFQLEIVDMIEKKYLSDIEGFCVKTNVDLSDIDDHNHDFSIRQLYKKLSTSERNSLIIETCKNEMSNRKTLIFCINIDHSKSISNLLNSVGLSAKHIDGNMNDIERNSILKAFRNGEISFLCNCQLLTEGFDEPSIDGIVLARPTKSRALFIQMIGRGLRIFPGKENCKIIDIVDNAKNAKGFNEIVTEENYKAITSFKNVKDIRLHIGEEMIKITEFSISRTDLIGENFLEDIYATDSMIDYLDKNKIIYFQPLSYDEGSFLIWHNQLKEAYNGINIKKN